MRGTKRGSLLAAGLALGLLPLSPAARAAELGGEESCSRADAHASQPLDGPATRLETAEAALAVEATRPLPQLVTAGQDDSVAATSDAAASTTPAHGSRTAVAGPEFAGPQPSAGWTPPPAAPAAGLLEPSSDADRLQASATTPLGFRDSAAPRERMRDLRRLRELKLLRLFDTRELMVWFGLDRKGRPGLHFRQRNPGEAMPPAAQSAFLADPPPLRSVPLTSP